MRKIKALLPVAAIATMALAGVTGVSAIKLDDINVYNIGDIKSWADATEFNISYDQENDINNVEAVIRINPDSVKGVLDVRAGNPNDLSAIQGGVYFGIDFNNPGDDPANGWLPVSDTPAGNNNDSIYNTTDPDNPNRNVAQVKEGIVKFYQAAEDSLANRSIFDNPNTFWPSLALVAHRDSTTGTFVVDRDVADGSRTIGEYLLEELDDKNDISELVYGEDYIIQAPNFGPDGFILLSLIQHGEEATAENIDWVKVTYKIEFSIYTEDAKGNQAYFPSIESAIAAGETEIFINDDIVVDKSLEIPSNVTLDILEGASLEVVEGGQIINKGSIVGAGNLVVDGPTITVNGLANDTHVVILEGGADHDYIQSIVKKNSSFADFIASITGEGTHSVFLTLDGQVPCAEKGCDVTITLSKMNPNTVYYLYHHDADGKYEFVDSIKSDAAGNLTLEIEKFSVNFVTTKLAAQVSDPVGPTDETPEASGGSDDPLEIPATGAGKTSDGSRLLTASTLPILVGLAVSAKSFLVLKKRFLDNK